MEIDDRLKQDTTVAYISMEIGMDSNIPTNTMTPKNCGKIFSNDFQPFLRAIIVFFLSFVKDKTRATMVNE